jgi:hypothetical protein
MELALNLVWVIIAVVSYVFLICRLAKYGVGDARGSRRARCILALTCFLATLFPVISLIDVLHEMQATAEEASPSGLVMKGAWSAFGQLGRGLCMLSFYFPRRLRRTLAGPFLES